MINVISQEINFTIFFASNFKKQGFSLEIYRHNFCGTFLSKLHDYIVKYLEEIYPNKDINRDVDAEGNTKSIKIRY